MFRLLNSYQVTRFQWCAGPDCDIAGDAYSRLVESAAGGFVVLVSRPNSDAKWLNELRRTAPLDHRETVQTSIWPGTQMCSIPVSAHVFHISNTVVQALLLAKSLWAWGPPGLPEDIAFADNRMRLWFYSTTHEFQWAANSEAMPPGARTVLNPRIRERPFVNPQSVCDNRDSFRRIFEEAEREGVDEKVGRNGRGEP